MSQCHCNYSDIPDANEILAKLEEFVENGMSFAK